MCAQLGSLVRALVHRRSQFIKLVQCQHEKKKANYIAVELLRSKEECCSRSFKIRGEVRLMNTFCSALPLFVLFVLYLFSCQFKCLIMPYRSGHSATRGAEVHYCSHSVCNNCVRVFSFWCTYKDAALSTHSIKLSQINCAEFGKWR